MNLKLVSDFTDFYDHAFFLDGIPFRRVTSDGPDRLGIFKLLRNIGLDTPIFGHPAYLSEYGFSDETLVVVHTDCNAHCGEGKELKKLGEIKNHESPCLVVEYVKYPAYPIPAISWKSMSTRLLFVGNRCFKYNYFSYNDWRSNCGYVKIENFDEVIPYPKWRDKVSYPLFSVDFVGETPKAIDFNIAPGTTGIPELKKVLPPTQFVLTLKDYINKSTNG